MWWMQELQREAWHNTAAGARLASSVFNPRAIGQLAVALAITLFLLVKATELNLRMWRKHQGHPVLVVLVAWFLASLFVAGVRHPYFANLFWNLMLVASFLVWTLASKIIDVYYDPIFQRQVTFEVLTDDILHRPWWSVR